MRISRSRDFRERGPRGFMAAGIYYWAYFRDRPSRNYVSQIVWARTAQEARVAAHRSYARGSQKSSGAVYDSGAEFLASLRPESEG